MQGDLIGSNTIFLTEVDSTNSYASALLKNVKPPEGTVISAQFQHAGRGQRKSSWQAMSGMNITLSVILYPSFLDLRQQHFLYKMAALACYDTIAGFIDPGQYDIKIKWPNDILINRRKICGILIENQLVERHIQSAVLGIGLNVNQTEFSGLSSVVSMKSLLEHDLDLKIIRTQLCHHLDHWYTMLRQKEWNLIQDRYLQELFGLNQWIDFEEQGHVLTYKIKGLGQEGLLMLERADGSLFEADLRQLHWIY